jgi:uncharacterized protein (TIGR02145 family)
MFSDKIWSLLSYKEGKMVKKLIFLAIVSIIALLSIPLPINLSANAATASSELSLSIASVINLAINNCPGTSDANSSSLTLDIEPTAIGAFKSNCQIASVDTNLPGYTLGIKSSSADLLYQNFTTLNPAPTIPATNTGTLTSPQVLPNDRWGYAVENQLNFDTVYSANNASNRYSSLPITDTQIYQTNQLPTSTDNFKFYYATRATLATLARQYKTTVTYTAIGATVPCAWDSSIGFEDARCVEPSYLSNLVSDYGVTTMQGLTSAICQSAEYDDTNSGVNDNNTAVLTDSRNSQAYKVRKLADGNCWMINNLRIALSDIDTADHALSNSGVNFAKLGSYTAPDNDGLIDLANFTKPRYYDPTCGQSGVFHGDCDNSNGDIGSQKFYGYLYNWCAATGATNGTCTSYDIQPTDSTTDICPAGWRLPTADGTWDGSARGSDFANLNIAMYNGTTTYSNHRDSLHAGNWGFSGSFRGVLAGESEDGFYSQGIGGVFWSAFATPGSSLDAFIMDFSNSGVSTTDDYTRYVGQAVRCLLR